MKSDKVLQGLKSYDLSHRCLNQTPGATAQSQGRFGSAFLKSPCRCSACFTVELVTAIIVEGRKCPCSGPLLAAGGDKSVPFTRRREMSTRRKAAGSETLNHILGTSTTWPWYPRLSLPDILHCQALQGTVDLCIWTLLNAPFPFFSLSDEVLRIQSTCNPHLYIENLVRVHLKCVAWIDKQSFLKCSVMNFKQQRWLVLFEINFKCFLLPETKSLYHCLQLLVVSLKVQLSVWS